MKPKQAYLSKEMEPVRIKEVETAAEELHSIRTERRDMTTKEDEAQSTLVDVMAKHKLKIYKMGNLVVTIEPGKTKAKVKEAAEPESKKDSEDD